MAFTKLQFWMGIILLVAVIGVSFMNFGVDVANNSNIDLNNDSVDYVTEYGGYVSVAGLEDLSEEDIVALKEDSLTEENETGKQSVSDFLATINYYKSRVEKVTNTIKLVYNFPTFMLLSLGLPIYPFAHFINIVTVIIYIGLIILVIKLIRGG